jgi:hypothetical protein
MDNPETLAKLGTRYIANIIIIVSPDIHGYVYYMIFAKLLQEMYFNNCF